MPPSKRDELVEAAMRVFERQGFHTSGLDAVLREAGISRMTVYNHFRSKNDLIVAALRRKDECSRHALMTHVDQAPDPASRVRALFDFHERWFTCREFKGCMFLGAAAEFDDPDGAIPLKYGDIFRQTEQEYSRWNFDQADTAMLLKHFEDAEAECARILAADATDGAGREIVMVHPAYDQCIKASHLFNLLDARGVISVTERQAYIGRVRALAKACADAFVTTDAGGAAL